MRDPSPLHHIDGFIIDMDGVLWHGDTPLPGLAELFASLHERRIPYVLATNNATRIARQYSDKLAGFGIEVDPERILTSAEATARYLRREHPEADTVYVVGEPALERAMTEQGLTVIGAREVRAGAAAQVVVAGLARETLDYERLAMAALLIRRGAHFVATNADATFPAEIGLLPGAGAIVSLLETASGGAATVIGKPHSHLFTEALARLGPGVRSPAMVGDRLETDILGGNDAGLITILVLSGVAERADIDTSGIRPDFVIDGIAALIREIAGR